MMATAVGLLATPAIADDVVSVLSERVLASDGRLIAIGIARQSSKSASHVIGRPSPRKK
jgi:hypothetical protein